MMSDATVVVLTGADGIGIACAWSGGSCVVVIIHFVEEPHYRCPWWLGSVLVVLLLCLDGWRCTRVRYVDLREN